MSRWSPWLPLCCLLGCSQITEGSNGVVALGIRLPSPAAVEQGDTLALSAYALDGNGDTVAAPIYWRTLDDSILTIVDSTGLFTTSKTSGQARVQARVGSLRSDIVTLTLRPLSDTLRLTVADTITVPGADSASDTLGAVIESRNPAGGVAGNSILYEVVDSAAARGTVRFANGRLAFRASTGPTGAPASAVTLRRVSGATPPAVVQVSLSALRPSLDTVPGSGQRFVLLFP